MYADLIKLMLALVKCHQCNTFLIPNSHLLFPLHQGNQKERGLMKKKLMFQKTINSEQEIFC